MDIDKIINECRNRCILYKGGKLPKENYSEKDYQSDCAVADYYTNLKKLEKKNV